MSATRRSCVRLRLVAVRRFAFVDVGCKRAKETVPMPRAQLSAPRLPRQEKHDNATIAMSEVI